MVSDQRKRFGYLEQLRVQLIAELKTASRLADEYDLSKDLWSVLMLTTEISRNLDLGAGGRSPLPRASDNQLAQNPPTVLTLRQAVGEAQTAWAGKKTAGFGKAKERLESFVSTLHDYSFLFSLIPSDDKYTSLITGTISSIMSVNHRKIAEIFAQSLEEIDQDIRTVRKGHQISNSREMRYLVMELYVLIFDFLCQAMEWFQNPRHRFMASFNQGYGVKVDGNAAGIKKVVARIKLEAE
ncbi:hypothetical protein GGTG_07741 [Gaeumannomyces tritici R3-111a-1]|uniref:DUF7708 domain-containing protein n=1 Tax=Gaeumannomyces tritici (strain R3-111a-1) TaxID=644352 RepID=J3P2J5_GAET3|nr:hypothetical protein GGTG_07741 [Gaeumannomyces tritici R3-111a-1]EJT73887.1 hypothetical protein GGTG_07741 [Gaeumannomyces tritici R3-111a-1]